MDNSKGGRLIVLDFDDTLFLTHYAVNSAASDILKRPVTDKEQVRKLPGEIKGRIYNLAYSKYQKMMLPNVKLVEHLKGLELNANDKMIVLTANSTRRKPKIAKMVERIGIGVNEIHARSNVRSADEKWKLKKIRKYVKEYSSVRLYEDKIDNIKYIRSNVDSNNLELYLVSEKGAEIA